MISIKKAFSVMYMSFYSEELYKMVAKHWKGSAISYILSFSFIMVILICALTTYSYYNVTHKLYDLANFHGTPNSLAEKFIYNFPTIKIDEKGQASGSDKIVIVPFLKAGFSDQVIAAVVDLSADKQVDDKNIPDDIVPLLQFTKHFVYLLTDVESADSEKYIYQSITYERILKLLESDKKILNGRDLVVILLDAIFTIKVLLLSKYTWLFLGLFSLFAVLVISHLVTATITALIMYCIACACKYFFKKREFITEFLQIFRVSIVSVTPLMLISKIHTVIGINFLNITLYNYVIIILFVTALIFYPIYAFMVNSQRKHKR